MKAEGTNDRQAPDLRYPVGKFEAREKLDAPGRLALIESIAALPARLMAAVAGLSPEQLDAPYRPEGWTVRQVVHHLADSHLNGYLRFKLALTETEPTIKPYEEGEWARLEDARTADPEVSLALLESLHRRWVMALGAIRPEEWGRTLRHLERGVMTLDANLQLYEWHARHHVAHITGLRERSGW
ncbi:MAG TPA: putative metal-dependent hydrolase [Blastocatellia bacterium]|nr:putative metal-dependent hydrolase [Blastocatellia bacterium]